MASIRKERKGKFEVSIIRGNVELFQIFSNLRDAELWARYKEELIDNMSAFDVPKQQLVTLEDAVKMKIDSLKYNDAAPESINATKRIEEYLPQFMQRQIYNISYEEMLGAFQEMTKSIVCKGGCKANNSGHKRQISVATVLGRLRVLSAVYTRVIELGIPIDNVPMKVLAFMKEVAK